MSFKVTNLHQGFKTVFCAVRPPGHHAGRHGHTKEVETQGFCLLNNVAIGAYHAINVYNYKRVLIFDFGTFSFCSF